MKRIQLALTIYPGTGLEEPRSTTHSSDDRLDKRRRSPLR